MHGYTVVYSGQAKQQEQQLEGKQENTSIDIHNSITWSLLR